MNQNGLSGFKSGGVDQRLPCGGGGEWNRGGLLEGEMLRLERGFVLFRDGELGVAALFLETEIRINRVAGFEFGNLRADFLDHSGHVHPGNEWKLAATETTGPNGKHQPDSLPQPSYESGFRLLSVLVAARLGFQHVWSAVSRELRSLFMFDGSIRDDRIRHRQTKMQNKENRFITGLSGRLLDWRCFLRIYELSAQLTRPALTQGAADGCRDKTDTAKTRTIGITIRPLR